MLFKEIITVYYEILKNHINKQWKNAELFTVKADDMYSNHWALMG
jgi:hypothetical protein